MNTRKGILMFGGLRFRIMLPAVVFILVFSFLFILINNYYTSKLLNQRLEREAIRISKIIYESKFVLNPVYLERLGKVIEGRIAVFDTTGNIIAASFEENRNDDFLAIVNPREILGSHIKKNQGQLIQKVDINDNALLLVSQQLFFNDAPKSIFITILTPLDDLKVSKIQTATRTFATGCVALLIAFLVTGFVLKKITSSFNNILEVTEKIASGDFTSKVAVSDITELKTLAQSINQMSDKLMKYEKKLVDSTQIQSANKITAAMAHEIKNPLSSIKMLAQIIQKKLENDKDGSEMTAAFIKEINRVDNLVSDLRSLAGNTRYSFLMVNPLSPLEDVILLIRPKLNHLNIDLRTHIETDIPDISMDVDKIKQVLWNIMMNGAQSMPEGGTLEISLKVNKKEGIVEYSIKDDGPGIDPKDMKNIFTPFFSTKKEGIGIGLYVCKEIALAHKGEIKIDSTPRGTTVSMLMPFNLQG